MKIYLSTGGFQNSKVTKTIKDLNSHNIKNIELSGGKFEKLYKKKVVKLGKKNDLMLHNYFPRYEKPFVFNLASQIFLISIPFSYNSTDFSKSISPESRSLTIDSN